MAIRAATRGLGTCCKVLLLACHRHKAVVNTLSLAFSFGVCKQGGYVVKAIGGTIEC